MRSFTGRYWSALRRGGRNPRAFLQQRNPKSNESSLPVAAVDRHPGRIAIQYLQPFGNVRHADSRAAQSVGPFQQLRGAHADTVVFHFDYQISDAQTAAEIDAAALHFGRQARA